MATTPYNYRGCSMNRAQRHLAQRADNTIYDVIIQMAAVSSTARAIVQRAPDGEGHTAYLLLLWAMKSDSATRLQKALSDLIEVKIGSADNQPHTPGELVRVVRLLVDEVTTLGGNITDDVAASKVLCSLRDYLRSSNSAKASAAQSAYHYELYRILNSGKAWTLTELTHEVTKTEGRLLQSQRTTTGIGDSCAAAWLAEQRRIRDSPRKPRQGRGARKTDKAADERVLAIDAEREGKRRQKGRRTERSREQHDKPTLDADRAKLFQKEWDHKRNLTLPEQYRPCPCCGAGSQTALDPSQRKKPHKLQDCVKWCKNCGLMAGHSTAKCRFDGNPKCHWCTKRFRDCKGDDRHVDEAGNCNELTHRTRWCPQRKRREPRTATSSVFHVSLRNEEQIMELCYGEESGLTDDGGALDNSHHDNGSDSDGDSSQSSIASTASKASVHLTSAADLSADEWDQCCATDFVPVPGSDDEYGHDI